jgi:pyruvate formate lyase activating enzyme
VNTDLENVEQSAAFLAALEGPKKVVNILAYHNIAGNKYKKLGKEYDPGALREPTKEELNRAVAVFEKYGLEAVLGG